jgi:RNA polymerase sigma-70 factor, ECF subfamily
MPPSVRRDGPSDKTILRRARQGDRQSFLTLLHRYDPRLRRLALRLLADPNRLERVLSRAYLKAWRSLPFLDRSEPAAGWLYRVVYNTCINELRWEPPRSSPPAPPGDPVPLPAASTERRLAALRALRPAERIPLVLVDGEGFSLDTTARIMRRDPAQVAADLAQARGRWRAFVSGEPEPLPEPSASTPAVDRRRADAAPSIAPSPAATLAKLAALAAPTAPREPGGHVKLLAPGPGNSSPPPVSAKRPRDPRPEPPAVPRPVDRAGARAASPIRGGPGSPVPPPAEPQPPVDGAGASRARGRPGSPVPPRTEPQLPVDGAGASRGRGRSASPVPPPAEPQPPVTAPRSSSAADAPSDAAADAVGRENAGAMPELSPPPVGGTGARRKRRRDAKRAVRTRGRGGPASGAASPKRDGPGLPDDRDPG